MITTFFSMIRFPPDKSNSNLYMLFNYGDEVFAKSVQMFITTQNIRLCFSLQLYY